MAALQSELVVSRQWMSMETYGLIYGLARITPGTNLLAFCAGAGWQILGLTGALLAVVAVTAPAALIVVLLTIGYEALKSNPLAMAGIGGVIAAAAGMMATSAWQLLASRMRRHTWLRPVVIAGCAFVLSLKFAVPPIQVLALAALGGILWRGSAAR